MSYDTLPIHKKIQIQCKHTMDTHMTHEHMIQVNKFQKSNKLRETNLQTYDSHG
jgi:hypothetical protein